MLRFFQNFVNKFEIIKINHSVNLTECVDKYNDINGLSYMLNTVKKYKKMLLKIENLDNI